jgi:hypothetical protein
VWRNYFQVVDFGWIVDTPFDGARRHAVTIYSTKIVILSKNGSWGTLHEARTDIRMLLGLLCLLIVGGARSLDARFMERRTGTHA